MWLDIEGLEGLGEPGTLGMPEVDARLDVPVDVHMTKYLRRYGLDTIEEPEVNRGSRKVQLTFPENVLCGG